MGPAPRRSDLLRRAGPLRRVAALSALAALAACAGEPTPPPIPDAPPDVVPQDVRVPTPPPTTGTPEGIVPVELQFVGVGTLHKGFFAMPDPARKLGTALHGCVTGGNAQVVVAWDEAEKLGKITLKVPPGGLACMPTVKKGAVDLSAMVPVTAALATWRDDIANGYDLRLASFHVGVAFTRGVKQCTFGLEGAHPPDGKTFSRCVSFAGVERCADGDKAAADVRFTFSDPADADYLSHCLVP